MGITDDRHHTATPATDSRVWTLRQRARELDGPMLTGVWGMAQQEEVP